MGNSRRDRRTLLQILLFIYSLLMLLLLFGRSFGHVPGLSYTQHLRQNANTVPFYTISNYLRIVRHGTNPALVQHCIINLAGNILLFVPAGLLLPALWPRLRRPGTFLAVCTGIILAVELTQLFTLLGSFDVDDIILNLLGMTLGFLLGLPFRRKSK